jgi:predicted unusual protein kinase regulating ubiquinone biosynthesis (AarF/ABC1/UbiB family)
MKLNTLSSSNRSLTVARATKPQHNAATSGSGLNMRPLNPQDGAREALQPHKNDNPPPRSTQPVPMIYKGPPQARPTPSKPTVNTSNGAVSRPPLNAQNGARNTAPATPSGSGMSFGGMSMPSGAPSFSSSMMVAGFYDDENATTTASSLPLDYKYTWSKENYSTAQRTIDTWSFVLTLRARLWLLDQKWSYPGGQTAEKRGARARTLAIWIRERILQLGPTFIKLGQLFSTRSDLFPAEFVEELSKLQDRVPAFSSEKAVAIIERELGAPIDQLFSEFNPRPIAAASLGQVHVARLPTGEQVVVKVQRPGLKKLFDIDLENLRVVAEQLDKGDDGQGIRDFTGIYKECAQILYEEIDYINEGRNADRFRRNFKNVDWVQVPRVYWQRTSGSVMTMEYLPGPKITDVAAIQARGLDPKPIAKRATEAYLLQILTHGFFHADPHPGNIALSPNGSLIFYDFGMMGSIATNIRELLLDLFYGIARKDVDVVLRNLIALGIVAPTSGGDTLSVRRALAFFVDNIGRQAEQQETVAAIGEDLFAIAVDSPFRFPATFTFVLRAFATLEGIGKTLDPDFSFAVTAAPFAQELLDLQDARSQQTFLLEQFQAQATEVGQAAAAMPLRVQRIENVISQLEAGDLKLRVRDLEGERANRKSSVLHLTTVNAIASMGLLNVGVQLGLAGKDAAAGMVMILAGGFAVSVALGMRRVKRLDKFEDGLKGRGKFPSN